jgi:hypothetical protein
MTEGTAFLDIAGLDKIYPSRDGGIVALKDVSFSLGAGGPRRSISSR